MSATTITTNVHIDDHTPVDIAPLRAGAWTVQFGADAASNVTLFGDPVNLRVIAQRILDGIPAPGEGIDHPRATCLYPAGCTGCIPEIEPSAEELNDLDAAAEASERVRQQREHAGTLPDEVAAMSDSIAFGGQV